jgi:hypothetical protein
MYDTRTLIAALWHFWDVIHFIESVSYRIHELWESSTPVPSTNSSIFNYLIES